MKLSLRLSGMRLCNLRIHLDEYAPLKKITRKELKLMTKPWISSNILNKCKYRDSLLHNISKEKDPRIKNDLHTDCKKLRNEITKEKCLSKKAYFTSYFEKNKQKSSDIWKVIRSRLTSSL